jgi:hypothetical protein
MTKVVNSRLFDAESCGIIAHFAVWRTKNDWLACEEWPPRNLVGDSCQPHVCVGLYQIRDVGIAFAVERREFD